MLMFYQKWQIVYPLSTIFGLIAQWIEHPPSKRAVVGSSPTQSNSFITRPKKLFFAHFNRLFPVKDIDNSLKPIKIRVHALCF